MRTFQSYFAEFFGTFCLCLFGCGTAVITGCTSSEINTAYVLTALAFGLVLFVLARVLGPISGCHVNPAVSLAKLLCGSLTLFEFFGYVIAQCLGAIAGSGVLYALFGTDRGLGQNALWDGSIVRTLIVEAILTAVFVFVILALTEKEGEKRPCIYIGLTLFLVHIFGIALTGTSVNPARSFGPALFVGGAALQCLWVFVAATFAGAIVAVILWTAFFGRRRVKQDPLAVPAEKTRDEEGAEEQ